MQVPALGSKRGPVSPATRELTIQANAHDAKKSSNWWTTCCRRRSNSAQRIRSPAGWERTPMDGIKVVAHLVRCAADLLMCTDFDTERLRYADVETCRTSLPALIREFQSLSTPGDVVMGRCHFSSTEHRSQRFPDPTSRAHHANSASHLGSSTASMMRSRSFHRAFGSGSKRLGPPVLPYPGSSRQ